MNRLIYSSSPYLLQHAHNPVDWRPWDEESLAAAKVSNKLLFVSVGYATCHWCHVMEEESFEDLEIAQALNSSFLAIKVDREERPDLDRQLMEAVTALRGRGGWPMTVVLTPDLQPVFAATYIPARDGDRGGRTGLLTILRQLSSEWQENPKELTREAGRLAAHLAKRRLDPVPGTVPSQAQLQRSISPLLSSLDLELGGFVGAPKFPRATDLLLLTHLASNDALAKRGLKLTLKAMRAGGICDHLGGGFHRYSTDKRWAVPHFEKMLYDQGQLMEVYSASEDPSTAAVAEEIARYLIKERMTGALFRSATDADSPDEHGHRVEGAFFTWTKEEVKQSLSADQSAAFIEAFMQGRPQLDGRFVLFRSEATVSEEELAGAISALYKVRALRPPPPDDTKLVTAWNALTIRGLALSGHRLHKPDLVLTATKAAEALWQEARTSEGWVRIVGGSAPAVGEDLAASAYAFLAVFQATMDPVWLERAKQTLLELDADYKNSQGVWVDAKAGAVGLAHRSVVTRDGAEPSVNSLAIRAWLEVYQWTLDGAALNRVDTALAVLSSKIRPGSSGLILAASKRHQRSLQLVVVSPSGVRDPFESVVLPGSVTTLRVQDQVNSALAAAVPWSEGKKHQGAPTAYLCELGLCQQPTTSVVELKALLHEVLTAPLPPTGEGQSRE